MEEIGDDELKEEIDSIIKHINKTMKKIENVLPQKTAANLDEAPIEPQEENQPPQI